MFEKLKSRLLAYTKQEDTKKQKQQPVLITIHGYGRRRKHEMDNLALWSEKEGYEIVQFDMYDLFDEQDNDWMKWVTRAKNVVNTYELANREIYLLGFSMGGVIASYLAATSSNVKKLILIAPAFQYLHMDTITSVISKGAAGLFSSDKDKKPEIEIPRSFYGAFMDLVKALKRYIGEVQCPVLILHGDEDEVIPLRSSTWAFERIPHEQKKLIILHGGHHRLLMDQKVNWETYQIVKLFLDDHILHGQQIPFAPDILEQYQRELEERIALEKQEKEAVDHKEEIQL